MKHLGLDMKYIYWLNKRTLVYINMQTIKPHKHFCNLMVAPSCVCGRARLAVGHVQISPITNVPQSHTVERVA